MSRRAWLALVPAATVLRSSIAYGQRAGTPVRVGWFSYLGPSDPALEHLRAGLVELGYVEGKTFVIVPRFAEGDFKRLPKLIEELAAERPDVVVSRGPSTDYARVLRNRVPVVFVYSGDPIAAGFADTLRRPGRNMTGLTFMAYELSAKRVDVLKELVPRASKVALLSNPEHAGELEEYRVTDEAARRVGLSMTRYLVRSPQELSAAYAEIRAARPDAMLVFPDSLTLQRRAEIAEFAARERIPTMYGWTEFVEAGGLVSYGPAVTENWKVLAKFVDKILKGADANTLPIEQVTRIGLALNVAAAKSLGLTIPQSILARADRVIE